MTSQPESTSRPPAGSKVEVLRTAGGFQMLRNGQPFYVKGAVYWTDPTGRFPLRDLAARGGNSVRCGNHIRETLDEAHRLGVAVHVYLRMERGTSDSFDYADPETVAKQAERIRQQVLEFRDHPALLMWGVGNELDEMTEKREAVWKTINDHSRMIHELDPHHPTLTVIGTIAKGDHIREAQELCPDLDLLGINQYQGVEKVPAAVRAQGWDRPYVICEWGPSGDWQVPRTEWGASIEETSTEKAQRFIERYRATMLQDPERCLGSYAFMWDWRMERTHTWYGMFLESGERTETVHALEYLWTGRWPELAAPRVQPPRIDGLVAGDNVYLLPGSTHTAIVAAEHPNGLPLQYRWEIVAEVQRAGYAGRGEVRSKPMPELLGEESDGEVVFTAPDKEGAYRVFVFVTDGQGCGATANIPFFVRSHDPEAKPGE